MARPKKDGRRAKGIQGKKGYLYIVVSQTVVIDGIRKSKKEWISTGLTETAQNVKRASEARARLLQRNRTSFTDQNITLADYTDLILEKKKREVADTTYSAYYFKLKKIKEAFGSVKVKEVTEVMVEDFLDSLFEKDHLKPRTVKDIKVLFAKMIDQAVQDGITVYNPVKEVAINKKLANLYAAEQDPDKDFFSYEEARRFLGNVKDHEFYELFYITLFFGLRREETLGLRWSAIDFKNRRMLINHTVTKGTKVNRTNTTKTLSSTRSYPLTNDQVEMFRQMKAKEKVNRKLCGNSYHDNDYIFKRVDGSLIYPDTPSKVFKKLIKTMPDLPQNITFHGLRKSCVSILVHQGMDIKSIQEWVGHSDINTTLQIYTKVKKEEAMKEVSAKMNGVIQIKDYEDQ